MIKKISIYLVLTLFIIKAPSSFAYSEKTIQCIDRLNGVLITSFDLESVTFKNYDPTEPIEEYCLAYDSEYEYSDLKSMGKFAQDMVDNIFASSLFGRQYLLSYFNLLITNNLLTNTSKDSITSFALDSNQFTKDSQQDWMNFLTRGLSDGYVYYQDFIIAGEGVIKKYDNFYTSVIKGLEENYICSDGNYSNFEKTNCSCLSGYKWNELSTKCIDLVDNPALISSEVITGENEPDDIKIPFKDIAENHKNLKAIIYLNEAGIIKGYDDGTFRAETPINRAELLKILVEGVGIHPSLNENSKCFIDVAEDWYAPYVCYAKSEGWIDGYQDGTFKPSQTVTKAEAIKMLLNTQGVDVEAETTNKPYDDVNASEWFATYIRKAKDLGLLEESSSFYYPNTEIKRSAISENLFRILTN